MTERIDNILQLINDEILDLKLEQFDLLCRKQQESKRYHAVDQRILDLVLEKIKFQRFEDY